MTEQKEIYDISAEQSKNILYGAAIPNTADSNLMKKIVRQRWKKTFIGGLAILIFMLFAIGFIISVIYISQSTWNSVSIGSTIATVFVGISLTTLIIWKYNNQTKINTRKSIQRCSIGGGFNQCVKLVFDM